LVEKKVNNIRLINNFLTDGHIVVKNLDSSELYAAVGLFNCSRDMYFATGIKDTVTYRDVLDFYKRLAGSNEDFILGICLLQADCCPFNPAGKLVGIVSGKLSEDLLWIRMMAILPEYRGSGLGSRAAGLIFEYIASIYKAREAFLSVLGANTGGLQFWVRQGFVETARIRKALFNEMEPSEVVIMKKRL